MIRNMQGGVGNTMNVLVTLAIALLAFILLCVGIRLARKGRRTGRQAVPINFEVYKAKEQTERQTRFS